MPTYEYRCSDCDRTFEEVLQIRDHETMTPACPACGGTNVEQVFATFFAKTSRKS